MTESKKTVTLVGGGLAGALMTIYLARAGHRVNVFERRPDIRSAELVKGRSINLALSTRGIHALVEVGLAADVLRGAVPMRGRMIHSVRGRLAFQPYGKDDSEVINSVSRAGLNRTLLDTAGRCDGVELHFNERCVDIDLKSATAHFENAATGKRRSVDADVVVGADGAFSVVRAIMQRLDRFDYSQKYEGHGYKELTIPQDVGGEFRLEKNALHIWPRRRFMMIALPNANGSFTCTLFWPLDGENSFARLGTEAEVLRYFERWFPDAVPHMPALAADYLAAPPSTLVTIRCFPWSVEDKVVLIGDAAHAVVPFYGQGMNAAFEDCSVLNDCLQRSAGDWRKAFGAYENARKPHADALADLALENFVEMRDHVASRGFLLKKKVEKTLHKVFPRWYIPLYSLVTFSRTPYAEACARARRQERIVKAGMWGVALILIAIVVFVAEAIWH
ncbi:MAG: FAD-dependent monooxygenase [Planctomycetes bacterium]|nr:FAD-dependent monooxygenase [Planctomycetota bacterium]